jgi:uncharacterized membrane protein YphA (DoxX/SURF4 family)
VWKPELWLVLIRVVTGAVVVAIAWGKFTLASIGRAVPIPYPSVSQEFLTAQAGRLAELAIATPFVGHRRLVRDTFLPHASLVGTCQAWAELAVGASLVLGLLTGLGALVGLVVTLHVGFAAFVTGSGLQPAHWLLSTAMLAFLGSRAGRAWGVDAILRRRAGGLLRYLLAPLT